MEFKEEIMRILRKIIAETKNNFNNFFEKKLKNVYQLKIIFMHLKTLDNCFSFLKTNAKLIKSKRISDYIKYLEYK